MFCKCKYVTSASESEEHVAALANCGVEKHLSSQPSSRLPKSTLRPSGQKCLHLLFSYFTAKVMDNSSTIQESTCLKRRALSHAVCAPALL